MLARVLLSVIEALCSNSCISSNLTTSYFLFSKALISSSNNIFSWGNDWESSNYILFTFKSLKISLPKCDMNIFMISLFKKYCVVISFMLIVTIGDKGMSEQESPCITHEWINTSSILGRISAFTTKSYWSKFLASKLSSRYSGMRWLYRPSWISCMISLAEFAWKGCFPVKSTYKITPSDHKSLYLLVLF